MINLLPIKEKNEFLEIEKQKIIIILGSLVLLFLISLMLVLFSVRLYVKSQINVQRTLVSSAEKQSQDSAIEDIQQKIQLVNQTFTQIDSFYKDNFYVTEILKKITDLLPLGVYLRSFSFSSSKIFLTGFAPDRETVFQIKQNLESQPEFTEVSFPPLNWVKAKDIDFTASFEI